ncbi:MAG: hypothetical protein ACTHMD_03175, partial [Flavisolibacter sp.]
VNRADVFFADFFSSDSLQHKRAVKNIVLLKADSSHFTQIKNAIESLSWKEKKYMDAKNSLVYKLSDVPTKASADYLKQVYYAAGDTVDLQYTALEALLQQKNAYAYQVFKDIMVNEPPVLDLNSNRSFSNYRTDVVIDDTDEAEYSNGSFLDELKDSLLLTQTIFKDLLPLITINDYEQPVMDLLETMVDSSMITGKEYELYLPKFLIEAKQEMKKQVISEKNRAIERAQANRNENGDDERESKDFGNNKLSTYATLLMPFWNENQSIPQLFTQMLRSSDKRLQYNTAMLMIRNTKVIPDSLLNYFAKQDQYRFELYKDLKSMDQLQMFPAAFNNHIDLAKSKLMSLNSYQMPDSILYVDKFPLQYKKRNGLVYFFKYKRNKDDNSWKIAMAGLIPSHSSGFEFENMDDKKEVYEYDFTEMTGTKIDEETPLKSQLQKALKKKLYSKRKSSAQFYDAENNSMQLNSLFSFRD